MRKFTCEWANFLSPIQLKRIYVPETSTRAYEVLDVLRVQALPTLKPNSRHLQVIKKLKIKTDFLSRDQVEQIRKRKKSKNSIIFIFYYLLTSTAPVLYRLLKKFVKGGKVSAK